MLPPHPLPSPHTTLVSAVPTNSLGMRYTKCLVVSRKAAAVGWFSPTGQIKLAKKEEKLLSATLRHCARKKDFFSFTSFVFSRRDTEHAEHGKVSLAP